MRWRGTGQSTCRRGGGGHLHGDSLARRALLALCAPLPGARLARRCARLSRAPGRLCRGGAGGRRRAHREGRVTPPRARASAAVSAIADTPAAVGLGALLPAFAADVAARHAAGAEGRSRGPRTALALLDQAL